MSEPTHQKPSHDKQDPIDTRSFSEMRDSHRPPKGWTPEKGNVPNKASAARKHEPITIERLERALAFAAYLVVLDGPVMVPFFERLERELQNMRSEQDAVARAKALLESYRDRPAYLSLAPPNRVSDAIAASG
jgi:hypothetical protein